MNKINAETWSFPQPLIGAITNEEMYNLIVKHIEEGILKPGEKLPAYRKLAKFLKRSEKSMERLYSRLESQGWLEGKKGSGTFVTNYFPNYNQLYPETRAVQRLPVDLGFLVVPQINPPHFHDFISVGPDTPGSHYLSRWLYLLKTKEASVYKKFNMLERVTAIHGEAYKAAILVYLNANRGFMINTNGLEVIVGRRESLVQVFNVLLKNGDVLVNTSPKDNVLCDILKGYKQVEKHTIDMDQDFLPNLIQLLSHTKIKTLYIRPQCSYPNSYTLDSNTCAELLLLAKKHGFYIIEEDDYHEFWYERKPFKPLVCYDHHGHVIYCGALSLISAYLQQTRTIIAAEEFIELIKLNPLENSSFRDIIVEYTIIELLNNNKLWKSMKLMQGEMTQQFNEAWAQIENAIYKMVKLKKPISGLTFWLTFPDEESMMKSITLVEKGGFKTPYLPHSQRPKKGVRHIRLGFGTWDMTEAQAPLKMLIDMLN